VLLTHRMEFDVRCTNNMYHALLVCAFSVLGCFQQTQGKLETAYAYLCFFHARQVYSSPHRNLTRLYQPPDSSQALTLVVEILLTSSRTFEILVFSVHHVDCVC